MDLILNLMKDEHLKDVLEVSNLSLKESWSEDAFKKELSNPLAKYIVALDNNKAVGFAGVWTIVDEGHITNIAVHPDYRGKGIGTSLVKELITHCNNYGIKAFTLEVRASNKIAQSLYSSLGFKEEGVRKKYYRDNGEDAIIMWKK